MLLEHDRLETQLVRDFLSQPVLPLYVNGQYAPARKGNVLTVHRPDNRSHIATIAAGDATDIDDAVRAGQRAFPVWAAMPSTERAAILHRFADLIDAHIADLAYLESIDVGKPIRQAREFDVPFSANAFRYFADLSTQVPSSEPINLPGIIARVFRAPYGVCGVIVPWNFPLMLLAWNSAPALAAGNTVVIKPAALTSLTALFVCRLAEEAGIPPGVFNVVTGAGTTAGSALSEHAAIKHIAFTGSPEVGRVVARAAAGNLVPSKMELGGKGAAVVLEDADVPMTAQRLSEAITLNAGQVCCTATRWFVQRSIFDEFMDSATTALDSIRLGASTAGGTDMGPLVDAKQQERVARYIREGKASGASLLYDGAKVLATAPAGGYFSAPMLLTGDINNICAREEIFGPVAFVLPFDEVDSAIEQVNSSPYGLANSVWSANNVQANAVAERLVAGNSWINAHNVFAYGLPYGGINLSGFGGGVNGPQAFFDYLRHQTIAEPFA